VRVIQGSGAVEEQDMSMGVIECAFLSHKDTRTHSCTDDGNERPEHAVLCEEGGDGHGCGEDRLRGGDCRVLEGLYVDWIEWQEGKREARKSDASQ